MSEPPPQPLRGDVWLVGTEPGFASWVKFFGDPFNYKVIADTLLLGLKTVCATVVVGYPLALVYMDLGPRLQKVLLFIIIMPMLLSVVVRTFAWIVVSRIWLAWRTLAVRTARADVPAGALEASATACEEGAAGGRLGLLVLFELTITTVTTASTTSPVPRPM